MCQAAVPSFEFVALGPMMLALNYLSSIDELSPPGCRQLCVPLEFTRLGSHSSFRSLLVYPLYSEPDAMQSSTACFTPSHVVAAALSLVHNTSQLCVLLLHLAWFMGAFHCCVSDSACCIMQTL